MLAGTRASCGIRIEDKDEATSTSIHCWGNLANAPLDHFEGKQSSKKDHEQNQIVLGQDHACATTPTKIKVGDESSLDSNVQRTPLAIIELLGQDHACATLHRR